MCLVCCDLRVSTSLSHFAALTCKMYHNWQDIGTIPPHRVLPEILRTLNPVFEGVVLIREGLFRDDWRKKMYVSRRVSLQKHNILIHLKAGFSLVYFWPPYSSLFWMTCGLWESRIRNMEVWLWHKNCSDLLRVGKKRLHI